MNITEADIAAAKKLRACPEAIAWLREKPRTMAQLVEKNHFWARWIIRYAPEPWAARAWAALRPQAANIDLRWIIRRAPEPWAGKAQAALARQEKK